MENINFLIIDNKPKEIKPIHEIINKNGYKIFEAPSYKEAKKIMEKENIHIILLKTFMPGSDGYQVCQEIRNTYYMKPIQIILISRDNEDKDFDKAISVGTDDFIKKPFNNLELQARIKAAVIRFRNQLSLYQEREFFKNAVFQEERLSAKVLDENLYLKRIFQDVSKQNEELKRANEELEKIAMFDMLSGLLNRLSLFNRIDIEIERAMRSMFPLTGIMLDIDHFKRINDNFGHQCGDLVIRHIGKMLRNQLRKYDYAGRYGGEEFFIILPNTNLNQAYNIGERFRMDIEKHDIPCMEGDIQITVSMGIAQYRAGEDRDKWISRADRAMYLAKQQGRNRVVLETV